MIHEHGLKPSEVRVYGTSRRQHRTTPAAERRAWQLSSLLTVQNTERAPDAGYKRCKEAIE